MGRKVKTLRSSGLLPANLYGKKIKSQALQVDLEEFVEVFKKAGETSIIELALGAAKKPVLVSDIQVNPVSDELVHVDFRQVDLKEKLVASVPVIFVGESPAEKSGLGTAVTFLNEIEVKALPTDLPEKFEVDISKLDEVDKSILVKDLKYDKSKVEIEADTDQLVVKVQAVKEEEEEEVPAPVEEDAEVVDGEEGEVKEGGEAEGESKRKPGETKETADKDEKDKSSGSDKADKKEPK